MLSSFLFFFFNDTATTEIYTLSLHDALPIYHPRSRLGALRQQRLLRRDQRGHAQGPAAQRGGSVRRIDRKSTRLNSSHVRISYAVFCLKKKKEYSQTFIMHNSNSEWQQKDVD